MNATYESRKRDVGSIIGFVRDEGRVYAAIHFAACRIVPISIEVEQLRNSGIDPAEGVKLSAVITPGADEELYVHPSAFEPFARDTETSQQSI